MITQALIKHVRSLERKKFRNQYGQFIAEGDKIVRHVLESGLPIENILAVNSWINANRELLKKRDITATEISEKELERISQLKTANQVVAVIKKQEYKSDSPDLSSGLSLVLDNIQDPGNMGTIIRTADWFGVRNIYCSPQSADFYNPKVIQATMGSFIRVKVHYTDLPEFFNSLDQSIPVLGAFLNGTSLRETRVQQPCILVIGNESNGISKQIERFINQRVYIPQSNQGNVSTGPESLNAAMAAGIIMAWIRQFAVD